MLGGYRAEARAHVAKHPRRRSLKRRAPHTRKLVAPARSLACTHIHKYMFMRRIRRGILCVVYLWRWSQNKIEKKHEFVRKKKEKKPVKLSFIACELVELKSRSSRSITFCTYVCYYMVVMCKPQAIYVRSQLTRPNRFSRARDHCSRERLLFISFFFLYVFAGEFMCEWWWIWTKKNYFFS